MDLRLMEAEASNAERSAVDGHLGPAEEGASNGDLRVAHGGRSARGERHRLLPALHAIQDAIGWISPGALNYVCEQLNVPPADAFGVASFYSLLALEEQPPRVAHICDDIACRPAGAVELLRQMEGAIGVDNADLSAKASPCLGQCDVAPAVFFQLAGEPATVLREADSHSIMRTLRGEPPPGTLPPLPQAGEPGLRLLRRIGSVSLEGYRDAGGYQALPIAIELGPAGVIDEVTASGLRGRGGAAFPTAVKWAAVADSNEPVRYLICNADESEPGTFKDRVLMEGDPFAVVEAMTIAGITVGAEQGYLYVRGEYPEAERRVRAAIDDARSEGLLGSSVLGSPLSFDIEIRRGAGAYICGEETALMNSIEGFRGEPRNKPPFPTEHGLFGKPTVVNNVETLVNILDIVIDGGQTFANVGTAESSGTRLFCLSGAVRRPGVYEVRMGTTLGELIELAGGVAGNGELGAILLGGAAGTFVGEDALDLPLSFEGATRRGVSLGSGVVMIFDTSNDFAETAVRIASFFRDESCGQCVPCRVGTVRQEELLARHLVDGQPLEDGLLAEIEAVMADASICGLGHTAGIAIRSAVGMGLLG